MDIGERDLENPLGFDKVAQAKYSYWDNYANFNEVISNSKKRVAQNETFKLIDKNARWLKKAQDDTLVYLNLEAYKEDLEKHKNESLKYKAIKDFSSELTFTSPLYEKSILSTDKDLTEKREAWHRNLKKDIYMDEAVNVLSELKIKPEYILVKN
jgi:carboxyl-terminal processing protease